MLEKRRMKESARPQHLASLQAFRGLAALAVVFYHTGLFSKRQLDVEFCGDVFRFGELGVDFFFVLSGFIITLIHWRDLGIPSKAPRYLWRRFIRIYPLLFFVTTAKLGLQILQTGGLPADIDLSRILASYLMIPPPDGQFPIVTAAWSLSHEALFYALFLAAILLGKRATLIAFGAWGSLIALLEGFQLSISGSGAFIFDNHNLEFILGVGVCLLLNRPSQWSSSSLPPQMAVTAAFLISGMYLFEPASGIEQTFSVRLLIGLGCAGIIHSAVVMERAKSMPTFPRFVYWLGDASYSIYLGHSMVLLICIQLAHPWLSRLPIQGTQVVLATFACVAVAATSILWRFVEKPLLDWSKKPSR